MEISGSNIIITGGARGMGRVMAKNFARKRASVAVMDIAENDLNSLKETCPTIETYVCDISDSQAVQKTVDAVYEKFSSIEILINNAGIMFSAPIIKMGSEDIETHDFCEWDRIIAVNLSSYFYVTACVLKKMVSHRTKGVIVSISSISARGNAGQSAYSASKAGIEALTKTWAKELGPMGIRAVCIAPGFIDTEGTHGAISEAMIKSWKRKVPLKRLGTIEEITNAVTMMIENEFFNGKILELDGGLVI